MLSDHELSVPTSWAARSWTLSFQVPDAMRPLKLAIVWLVMTRLSAEPPARLLTTNCVPSGAISVTSRSPRNVCVMLSDSDSEPTVPAPTTARFEVMPVVLLSGIASGRPVALNAPLTQTAPAPQPGSSAWGGTLTASQAALTVLKLSQLSGNRVLAD